MNDFFTNLEGRLHNTSISSYPHIFMTPLLEKVFDIGMVKDYGWTILILKERDLEKMVLEYNFGLYLLYNGAGDIDTVNVFLSCTTL